MGDFKNSWAVVVGIDNYKNGIPILRTAVNDARRLADLLERRHGYRVECLAHDVTDLRLKVLITSLDKRVGPDDRLLFYFAGHGIAYDGDDGRPAGYLIPENAERDKSKFLAMEDLHASLTALKCRHMLLILDCCFAAAFRWSSTRRVDLPPDVLHRERYERYIEDPAWQVISSAYGEALDLLAGDVIGKRPEQEGHSPFADALFRGLEGEADIIPIAQDGRPRGDGVITATELYLYLRESVENATKGRRFRQTPGLWPLNRHGGGEYVFLVPDYALDLPPAPELNDANNPYLGLRPYEERDSRFFFGRNRLIEQLQDVVNQESLTVVLGVSGTGKSSLVKAGLIPRLSADPNRKWMILEQVRAKPSKGEKGERIPAIRPGATPLKSLAGVARPGQATEPHDLARLSKELKRNPKAFAGTLLDWAAGDPDAILLLVIDQFEELVTLCNDRSEREQFLTQLSNALEALPDRFRLLITLRSDFEPQFATLLLRGEDSVRQEFAPRSTQTATYDLESDDGIAVANRRNRRSAARFVVPPLTQDELRDVIEKPASVQVLYFEKTLVDKLINEVVQMPGALPLLSFTLSELFRRYVRRPAEDRQLTVADYEVLGGVAGSLRRRATEIYDELGKRDEPAP